MTITDQLAERLGIDKQPIKRARAGVKHALEELCGNGHCAVYTEDLIKQSIELLEISQDLIQEDIYQGLKEEGLIEDIIGNKPVIYIDKLYYAEIGVARQIHRLNQGKSTWGHIETEKALDWVLGKTGLKLSESQRMAVDMALNSKVVCITGGPGVGKTTIVNSIIQIVKAKKTHVSLCAPTGRAAKRLSESTGLEAKTIHRLLEFDPNSFGFLRHDGNPIETDLLGGLKSSGTKTYAKAIRPAPMDALVV